MFFNSPIGIASSNLTADKHTLKNILKSTALKHIGCITLKTFEIKSNNSITNARIVFTDYSNRGSTPLFSNTIMCRGVSEWPTLENIAKLSKWLREELNRLNSKAKIKISLPALEPAFPYINIVEKLVNKKAEFDIVEIPLKYIHKQLIVNTPLNLGSLHNKIEEEFLKTFEVLLWLRISLLRNKSINNKISLKLAPENFTPASLAPWLFAPQAQHFAPLYKSMKEKFLNDIPIVLKEINKRFRYRYKDLTISEIERIIENEKGCEFIVLFDSEKFPTFFPDPSDYRKSILISAESSYPRGGGAITGNAIAKDSLKCTYETYYNTNIRIGNSNSNIISCGGCDSGYDLATRLIYGASLVELCTSILKNSFNIINKICDEFYSLLDKWGVCDWKDLIGFAHNKATERRDEVYFPLNFPSNNLTNCKKCNNCTVWCWYNDVWAKGTKWPPKKCKQCGACISLCKHDRFN